MTGHLSQVRPVRGQDHQDRYTGSLPESPKPTNLHSMWFWDVIDHTDMEGSKDHHKAFYLQGHI